MGSTARDGDRPRIIATTDGEIDDRCSMIRFLPYANEWEIEGIIYCSSKFHWLGHNWHPVGWIEENIDQYAQVYENLKLHDSGFPLPDELRKVTLVGNIDNVGEMGKDTPGSDLIAEVLLGSDPRPVYLQAWGGCNTIARALWKIEHEHPGEMERVSRKAIVYNILNQDDTFRDYIQPTWPDLTMLNSYSQFAAIAYDWGKIIPVPEKDFYSKEWMTENIKEGHGPLFGAYPVEGFKSEGDSPSFMHQIDVGLRSLEDHSYGGWGGRFVKDGDVKSGWRGAEDDGNLFRPIYRWSEAFQNDWAARADWCVKRYEEANHPPVVKLTGPVDVTVAPGDSVTLSAEGTSDPDGDDLAFKWWQYREPGTYDGIVEISDPDKQTASVAVPKGATKGRTIHVICEVADSGTPRLTRYARVIVTVG